MTVSFSPQRPRHLWLLVLLVMAVLTGVRCYLFVVLICISLIASEVEHLFIYLLAICMPAWERRLFMSSAHFLIKIFLVAELYEFFIHFGYEPLAEVSLASVFSQMVGCPLHAAV